MCKFSIVIPVFNMKESIARSIESVISQDYINKEILVLDGGSTDGTQDVIARYMDSIDYYVSERDGGSSAAIAGNMAHITGDYVAVLGGDDWYEVGALKAAAEINAKVKSDVLYGDYNEVMLDGQVVRKSAAKVNLDMVYYHCPFNTNAAFVRRELLEKYYLEHWSKHKYELDMAADHYLWLVLYHNGYRFSYIPSVRPIVNFSMTGRSNMNMKKLCEQNRKVLDYVLPKKDASYTKRVRICETYCITRMISIYGKMIDEDEFRDVLKKHLDIRKEYVIFGAGHMGVEALNIFSLMGIKPKYFVDNYATTKNGFLCGIKIDKPEILKKELKVTVIISSVGYEEEMAIQLQNMGLNEAIEIKFFTDICINIKESLDKLLE